MKYIFILSAIALVWSCLPACGDKSVKRQSEPAIPYQFSIMSDGGFTGMIKGFNLHSSGKVEYWQRSPAQKDSILWTKSVSADHIREFKNMLDSNGMLTTDCLDTGNMTTTVKYATADLNKTWSWGEQTKVPDNLHNWHDSVRKFCHSLSNQ